MKDPRECSSAVDWYTDAAEREGFVLHLTLIHADTCARLDAKDAEIEKLREALLGLLAHTKNNNQICGLNFAAKEALGAAYKEGK